jgi:hypothetical protein
MRFIHAAVQQIFRCKQCNAFPDIYTKELTTDYGYTYYSCFVYCKNHADCATIAEAGVKSLAMDIALHDWNTIYGKP